MKKLFSIIIAAAFCLSLAMGTAWAKPQENCPVMGGKINKSIYTDYSGKRIYFCCNACPEPFKKEPEKYMKKMEAEGVEFEKAPAPADKK
jgi:YHS domain-containing protein